MIITTITITSENCHHFELLCQIKLIIDEFKQKHGTEIELTVDSAEMTVEDIKPINENEIKF